MNGTVPSQLSSTRSPQTIAASYISLALMNREYPSQFLLETATRRIISECVIAISLVVSIAENIFYGLASLYTYCFDRASAKGIAFTDSLYVSAWCLVALVKNIYAKSMKTYRSSFLDQTPLAHLLS